MPDTRSSKSTSEFSELQVYFDNAIKKLASKDDIESVKILISEQNKVIEILTSEVNTLEKITHNQNDKIVTLEDKINKLEDRFEGEISFLKNKITLSDRKNDDLEQYGRRTSLRIDGLEFNEGESVSQCEDKVKSYLKEYLKLDVIDGEFDRIHRIGKVMKVEGSGKNVKQIIVKFKSFDTRSKVFRGRDKNSKVKVRLDLTIRRYKLLATAYNMVANMSNVKFVCANITCALCVHFVDGSWKFFNSKEELDKVLSGL